jgi:hypothetical protein
MPESTRVLEGGVVSFGPVGVRLGELGNRAAERT